MRRQCTSKTIKLVKSAATLSALAIVCLTATVTRAQATYGHYTFTPIDITITTTVTDLLDPTHPVVTFSNMGPFSLNFDPALPYSHYESCCENHSVWTYTTQSSATTYTPGGDYSIQSYGYYSYLLSGSSYYNNSFVIDLSNLNNPRLKNYYYSSSYSNWDPDNYFKFLSGGSTVVQATEGNFSVTEVDLPIPPISNVPLPPSVSMFSSALIGLMGLNRLRTKRKLAA